MGKTQVWFDEEGDFLEVTFANRKGSFREIGPDLYERVDANGRVIGFAIFNFLKRVSGNQNIPRPFVVKPPLTTQTQYAAGEPLVSQGFQDASRTD